MKPIWLLSAILLITSGCASQPKQSSTTLPTLYDSVIYDSTTQQNTSITEMAQQLATMDVIFIGEYHGHPASHLLQAKIQTQLFALNPNQVLTMEQFERDHQQDIDAYLDGEIGEKTFIKNSQAWKNYTGSYRPLVYFAKHQGLPVVAANAPSSIVRCVGRQGQDYLKKLNAEEKGHIAQQAFLSDAAYQEKFSQFQQKAKHGNVNKNSYYAQLLRDNTMAESILIAHQENPGHQILHINGTFHSERFSGTVALLKQRAPELKIAVISPIILDSLSETPEVEDFAKGSFVYVALPLEEAYVVAENRRKAMQEMFKKAKQKKCK